MQSPFLFGKTVSSDSFTNRTKDIARLKSNFSNQINTILISPRRWGKSSLIKKVASDIANRNTKVVLLDLFSIRDEEDFYNTLARDTIKATSNKVAEWVEMGKHFFKNISPKISFGIDPTTDFDISFSYTEIKRNYKDILNLPEKIALEKNIRIVVAIDEFQNLSTFKDPLLFQKRLRSEWQHHTKVTYCLYGSRQHMMVELFEKQSMPFYKFGDVMYLPKINRQNWIQFIQQQFALTKKNISTNFANVIASAVEDHSYYVQQLSHLVWINTNKTVTQEVLQLALESIIEQNALLYTRDTEELSMAQLNFLKAIASGTNSNLSSQKVMHQFALGTSANVLKIKKVLKTKELIDEQNKQVFFIDPVYALWFQKFILHKQIGINMLTH